MVHLPASKILYIYIYVYVLTPRSIYVDRVLYISAVVVSSRQLCLLARNSGSSWTQELISGIILMDAYSSFTRTDVNCQNTDASLDQCPKSKMSKAPEGQQKFGFC